MFKKLLAFVATMYVAMAFAAVDVNTATSAELDSIKGIGPVKSALILSERKKAPFKDWNDFVTRVKGVGTNSAAKFSAEGMTVNGARALGLHDRGTLADGQRADFVAWPVEHPSELAYWFGHAPAVRVVQGGQAHAP